MWSHTYMMQRDNPPLSLSRSCLFSCASSLPPKAYRETHALLPRQGQKASSSISAAQLMDIDPQPWCWVGQKTPHEAEADKKAAPFKHKHCRQQNPSELGRKPLVLLGHSIHWAGKPKVTPPK